VLRLVLVCVPVNETERPPDQAAPPLGGSPATPASDEEVVRKIYARDLREKDNVRTVFRVTRKSKVTARSGKVFVALSLTDRTGEIDGRIFDRVDELEPSFSAEDFVLVEGSIISFHGKPQLVVERLEKLDPGPLDAREFTPPPEAQAPAPASPPPGERTPSEDVRPSSPVGQIREIVERVQDPHVKALLFAFLDDPEIAEGLKVAPAAKGIHHAYKGGLADHLLSVMRLTQRVADHYPMADRDLLIAGALLHDIGKVKELSYSGSVEYTDEGRLVGHLVMTAQKIREKSSRLPHFPPLLEQHLTHLVLAHHGQLEYGSPKLPMTLEAYIVHMIDSLDSRVASWLEAMQRDPNEKWTEVVRHYDRHLWKGPVPTVRGRAPVEPRKRKEKRPKPPPSEKPTPPAAEGVPPATERPPRRERPPREGHESRPHREGHESRPHREGHESRSHREGREPKSDTPRLTFKPLAALAGEPPQKSDEPTPPPPPETPSSSSGEESQGT